MNNITIRNIDPQNITINGGGSVIGIDTVYVNGVDVTIGSAAYVIVPTKTSELTNNSGFITSEKDPTVPYFIKQITISDINSWNNKQDELVSGVNIKTINDNSILGSGNIDISTSYTAGTGININNENVISNTITSYNDLTDLPNIPTKTSDLTNDSNFVSSKSLAEVAFSGSFLDLSNVPTIPEYTSDLENDGADGINPYITNQTDSLVNYYDKNFFWNILPKVNGTGDTITLDNTIEAKMKCKLSPSEMTQETTTGKNLFDKTAYNDSSSYLYSNALSNISEILVMSFKDKNTSINIGGTYFGFCYNYNGSSSSPTKYNWVINNGQIVDKKTNLASDNETYCMQWFVYPKDKLDVLTQRYDIQIEKGSTATSYEPYTGGIASPNPQYPQDIHTITGDNVIREEGKNLFDGEIEAGYLDINTGANLPNTNVRTKNYISIIPDTQYAISSDISKDTWACYYDKSKTFISSERIKTGLSGTFTTPNNAYYIRWYDAVSTGLSPLWQLEKGSTATSYVPYSLDTYPLTLGTLEYSKIPNSDYEDEFIKATNETGLESGKWYLKKNLIKEYITSESTGIVESSSGTDTYRFRIDSTNLMSGTSGLCNNNKFVAIGISSDTQLVGINSGYIYYRINKSIIDSMTGSTSESKFKNWLDLNETYIEVPLITPTYTLLNDTLQEQLETIYNAMMSKKGQTNISQVNDDLPMVITASALLDLNSLIGG